MNEREKPILFSGPMVRAILEGRKTQTRRIVKPQFECAPVDVIGGVVYWDAPTNYGGEVQMNVSDGFLCPYGKPGARLWVRETWRRAPGLLGSGNGPTSCEFRATHKTYGEVDSGKWKPSIFMPRWACRIELEVVDIRVELLQEISEADAMAEGVQYINTEIGTETRRYFYNYLTSTASVQNFTFVSAVQSYATLWESINGPGSWKANPWVWCLTFRRIV